MITSDFHTHTWFSDDCATPLGECVEKAISQGIKTLAITDHYDPDYPNPDYSFCLDFDNYKPALLRAKADYPQIEIAAGVEVGIRSDNFDEINQRLKPSHIKGVGDFEYDVVLGSFHSYYGMDLSIYDFTDSNLARDGYCSSCEEFLRIFYEHMYKCLKEFDNYDILTHFSVIDRYIGKLYDYGPYEDVIAEILKLIISEGKALEINTSSFSYHMNTWLPRESILRLYRDLGGELITLGSDAHNPKFYRNHFEEAASFARSLGFRNYCTYKKRVLKTETL